MLDIVNDFPLLVNYNKNGHMVYADSAATTQKPQCVLDALQEWYTVRCANPHRGSYKLGVIATDIYEYSRDVVAKHINAQQKEVVFCRNTTEAINLVVQCFARHILKENDEVVIPISEHHSNLIPWQEICRQKKCKLVYLLVDSNGRIPEEELTEKITPRTRIVTLAQMSNVTGIKFPIREIARSAHKVGAYVVLDAAQGLLHDGLNVQDLEVDFAAFSAHKAFGPDGLGVLWGKYDLLKEMPPFFYGGEMIETVSWRRAIYEKAPVRFEAGTQSAAGAFAFAVGLHYIETIGQDNIRAHEAFLMTRLLEGMRGIPGIKIYGDPNPSEDRGAIVAFNFSGQGPLLIGRYLDSRGINVRIGTHCAQPLMEYLGTNGTCRISLAPYNTIQDIETIIEALRGVPEMVVKEALRRTK